MSNGLIVHCPSCGAALMALPAVRKVYSAPTYVQIEFAEWRAEHTCGRDE